MNVCVHAVSLIFVYYSIHYENRQCNKCTRDKKRFL